MSKEAEQKTGAYHGRLAFDPDANVHVDPDGHAVVTEDEGKTWRYATADDPSHFDRYHTGFATVDGTSQRFMELAFKHGEEKAEEIMRTEEPHHFDPQEGDPHFMPGARDAHGKITHTRITFVPDSKSVTLTGHTDATGSERS